MLIAGLGHGRRVIMYFRTLFYSSFTAESYDSEIRVYMTGTAMAHSLTLQGVGCDEGCLSCHGHSCPGITSSKPF